MEQNIYNGIGCSPHNGDSIKYCSKCNLLVCDQCSSKHLGDDHEIKNINDFALETKLIIEKYKRNLEKTIVTERSSFIDYNSHIKDLIEINTKNFKSFIAKYFILLQEKIDEEKDKIDQGTLEILTNLKNEEDIDEYNKEMEILDKINEVRDEKQISVLNLNMIKSKYNVKTEKLSNILSSIRKLKERTEKFLHKCKASSNAFNIEKNNLILDIEELKLTKIEELKKVNHEICEFKEKLSKEIDEATNILEQIAILTKEKESLKIKIDNLRKEEKETEERIESLQKTIEQEQSTITLLTQEIKEIKNDICLLDVTRMKKLELYNDMPTPENNSKASMTDIEIANQEMKLLMISDVIYIFDQAPYKLYAYHFTKKKSIALSGRKYITASSYSSVQLKNDLYIAGGFDMIKARFTKETYKISFISFDDIKKEVKAEMTLGKSQHKLVLVNPNTIYSLGGKAKDHKYLHTCERYDINNNKWKLTSSLNEAKLNIAAICFNCSMIYVFGGFKGSQSNIIEHLDVTKAEEKWMKIEINTPNNPMAKEELGCLHISENEILLFVGVNGSKGSTDATLLFNVKDLDCCILFL